MTFFDPRTNPPARNATDRFIRRFGTPAWAIVMAGMYAIAATAAGIALVPALAMLERWGVPLWHVAAWWRLPALGILVAVSVAVWGLTLMVVVPVYNWLLPTRIRPFKGGYFTVAAVPWYVHNALFYLVRFTVLPFATLTPIGPLFLQAMGMTLGKRVRIGTEYLSDVRLISVGDDAVVLAHSVLLPGTRIGAGERWGGVPARPIGDDEWKVYTTSVLRRG